MAVGDRYEPVPRSTARPHRSGGEALRDAWRSYGTAARLGWRIESNWADPFLFVIYSVAKPVASALILVAMVDLVAGAAASPEMRAFVVTGSALWAFVTSGVQGLAWSILDDRERYRLLHYLYVSPNSLLLIMLGRGTARIAIGAMGAAITLAMGVLLLGVQFDAAVVDWPLLAACMGLGLVAIVALGVLLAAVCLQTRQDSWSYPEAVTGALFLLVGAVFPLAVLPLAVQALGLLLPLTWWLEGVRRAAFPGVASGVGGPGSLWEQLTGTSVPGTEGLVVALSVLTAASIFGAVTVYRWSERRARERGLLDQVTGS